MRNLAGLFFRQVSSLDWPGGFFMSISGNSETKILHDNLRKGLAFPKKRLWNGAESYQTIYADISSESFRFLLD